MKTAEKGLREFMEEKPLSVKIYEIEQPDVPLWAIWAIQQYTKDAGKDQGYAMYGKLVADIIAFIRKGGHPNLRLDENGLLYSNGRNRAVTWMNSTANGRPVVPRSGYIVEFNALWYNALKFGAAMAADQGDQKTADNLEELAAKVKVSFVDTFVNEYGYLLDYVDGNMMDWSVRPNMIFAVALDYSPLSQQQMKSVVDISAPVNCSRRRDSVRSRRRVGDTTPSTLVRRHSATMPTIRVRRGLGSAASIWRLA